MPTITQIQKQLDDHEADPHLSKLERKHVRVILGIMEDPDNDDYQTVEKRMLPYDVNTNPTGFEVEDAAACRAIVFEYDKFKDVVVKTPTFSTAEQRVRLSMQLRQLVFPRTGTSVPVDNVKPVQTKHQSGSTVRQVSVNYSDVELGSNSEFGPVN